MHFVLQETMFIDSYTHWQLGLGPEQGMISRYAWRLASDGLGTSFSVEPFGPFGTISD